MKIEIHVGVHHERAKNLYIWIEHKVMYYRDQLISQRFWLNSLNILSCIFNGWHPMMNGFVIFHLLEKTHQTMIIKALNYTRKLRLTYA